MHWHQTDDRVAVLAPAKLNLFLEILARRDDGFHELETLMTAINICDTVVFTSSNEDRIRIGCAWAQGQAANSRRQYGADLTDDLPKDEQNLAWQAVQLFRDRTGVSQGGAVQLYKRIPSRAGLGGASSDAAAALLAANQAWNVGWTRSQLATLAAELGSDVPFFLSGGMAVCRGRGERIEPVRAACTLHLVVVRPPAGLSTAEVYRHCIPADRPASIHGMLRSLEKGNPSIIARHLMNRLEPAARKCSPWVERVSRAFDRLDCYGHQLSGSGTGYFGICGHARHARRVASRLRAMKVGFVFAVSTPRCSWL